MRVSMIQRIFPCIRKFTALSISLVFVATLLVSGCTGCGAGIRAYNRAGSMAGSEADNRASSNTRSVADSGIASQTPEDTAFEEFCNELLELPMFKELLNAYSN